MKFSNLRTVSFTFIAFSLIAVPTSSIAFTCQDAARLQKPLEYQVAVTVKLIQVYVTDKKGNAVQDLRLEDFLVFDNGKAVNLTEFEKHSVLSPPPASKPEARPQAAAERAQAETPPALAAPSPPPAAPSITRKFILFFDFVHNNQRGVKKSKEAALHFLDTDVRPGDELALFSYSLTRGLTINEFLTPDTAKVRKAVEAVDVKNSAGRADDVEQKYWEMVTEATIEDQERQEILIRRDDSVRQAQNFILKLTALAKGLRYVPGQKHILLFSTGIPNTLLYGNAAGTPRDDTVLSQANSSPRPTFSPPDPVLSVQYKEMYQELSSSNCSIFSFDSREAAMVPTLFDYDERTFGSKTSRDIFTASGVQQNNNLVFKDEKLTGLYTLTQLSKDTGGKYFGNIDEFKQNLDQVQNLTGAYYVLGYPIGQTWDGRFHEIKVEVKRKGCEVRAQSGYFNPKPFREYSDLEKELHLLDLALNERPTFETPSEFSMSVLAYGAGPESRLEMLSKLPLRVIAKFAGKRVEVVSLVFNEQDDLVVLRRGQTDLTKYAGMDVFVASGATAPPGDHKCRLIIRDLDTGESARASAKVFTKSGADSGLALYSPLLLVPESNFVYIEAGEKTKNAPSWRDIYPYERARYSPLLEGVPPGTARIYAVVPCSVRGMARPNIALTASLIDSATGARIPVPLSILNSSARDDLDISLVELVLDGIPPGKYLLYFYAEEGASKAVAYVQTSLVIRH